MALPGKLLPDRPVDARPVESEPSPGPSLAEAVDARFPMLGALLAVIGEEDDRARAEAESRVAARHRPVFDHGRNSAELAEDCPNPPGWCDHASRELVCGTCRDHVGEPLPAPCAELVDLGVRYWVDVG